MAKNRSDNLTFEEACVESRSGYGKVWRAVRRGELPSLRAGRRVLIPAAALRAWLARGSGSKPTR